MIVKTRWPALIPAIHRAGHEPVLITDEDGERGVESVGVAKGASESKGSAPSAPRSPSSSEVDRG